MKGRYTRRDFINLGILSVLYTFIILCIIGLDSVYGSQLDWENQHWVIPEYLRNRFYDTGQFFPSFAFETGGGQNIYYFAYYGLHSPFLYISYLFPFISMRSYIIGVNIIAVFASVWLFYVWMRGRYSAKVSMLTAVLFLTSSPLIFHSHRHIMFVDYLPFLIMTFIFVRRYMQRRGSVLPVTVSAFLLVTTSFFFSVGSFIAVGIYAVMLYLEQHNDVKFSLWECIKRVAPVVGAVMTAILMAGILLLPTAYALLSGRGDTSQAADLSVFLPQVRAELIMYGPYSMGLTAFSVYALAAAAFRKNRAHRLAAAVIGIMYIFPAVVYILNGGLYLDGKVLIPFLPLALIVEAEFFKSLFMRENDIKKIIISGTVLNILLLFTGLGGYERLAHIAVLVPVVICLYIYMRKQYSYIVCIPVVVISFIVCVVLNFSDNVVLQNYHDKKINLVLDEMAEYAIGNEESIYRFANGYGKWKNVNKVIREGYCQTTIYSSTCNKYFKDFYFEQMKNEVPYRNNAVLPASGNVLYNIYMGVKYYITESAYVPEGYMTLKSRNNVYLYESKDAYPIGYATAATASEEYYDSLEYPYTAELLMKYAVTDETKTAAVEPPVSGIKAVTPEYEVRGNTDHITADGDGYIIDLTSKRELSVDLKEPPEGKLLFIEFDVDNDIGGKSEDVSISINGISNKLTEKGWKYHNGNYTFEYVISSNEELETIDVALSKGRYIISGIRCFEMDYDDIRETRASLDEFVIDKDRTQGDIIAGEIDVKQDGWFHLSVPYDKGFTILVDGEKTEYSHSDRCFIGFDISRGKHDIEIIYKAPGIKAGKYMSAAGAAVFVSAAVCSIWRKRYNEKKHSAS